MEVEKWKRKPPLYPNLAAEMKRKGMTAKDYGEAIGIAQCGMSKRLRGEIEFSIGEMKKTKELFGLEMDYLFETSEGNL